MSACLIFTDEESLKKAAQFEVPKAGQPSRVVVAMSGGVDSSVAAWLLKEAGHEVIGVSLRLAPDDESSLQVRQGRCCSVDDMTDARQVCDRLGVPFYAVDARDRFKNVVFDPFVKAYRSGQTPIPCLACNHDVKFGDLYKTAKSLNARLATGHYAKIVDYKGYKAIGRPEDAARDQTYYLYGTAPEVVDVLDFPLGEMEKPLIRALAHRIGMKVSTKPDSQEICFVPDGNHAKVVERAGGKVPTGKMVTAEGKTVAEHQGVHHFTIGQRRGIGVGVGERAYVVDLDAERAQVTLGKQDDLACTRIQAGPLRAPVPVSVWPEIVSVQIRARQNPAKATWQILENEKIEFQFIEPVYAVALGQAAVIYDDKVLLGGGVITGRMDGKFPRVAA